MFLCECMNAQCCKSYIVFVFERFSARCFIGVLMFYSKMYWIFYATDEPEGKFLCTETTKLYRINNNNGKNYYWKVEGSNLCRSGGIIFFPSVDFLCWLLFRYPFHPRVIAVARKRSRSICQRCRWKVTAKHAYTLRMWLCIKWHGAWLYGVHRTCAETAAVSCGTSRACAASTPLRWIFKTAL